MPERPSDYEAVRSAPVLTNERATASVLDTLKENERLAAEDPAAALEAMEDFLAARGPHPQLLSRIAVLQRRLGREEALDTARRACETAVQVGNVPAVTELLQPFAESWDALGLGQEEWLKLGHAQRHLGQLETARRLYEHVLESDERCLPALKGLVQVADAWLKKEETAARAVVLYDHLEAVWPDHPFCDYVEICREEAQRRLQPS